jgi:signal transduction histidine kinase
MRPGLLSAQGLILDAMKDVEAMSGHSEHLVQSKPPVDTRHHLAGAHLSIVPLTGEPQSEPPRGPARRRRLSQGRGRFKITRSAVAEPREPDPIEIDLLSLVAHQLVTPLTLIDSAAQRMIRQAETLEPGEVKMRAGRIRTAADQLSTLVQSLLARAKLDGGRITLARQAGSLSEILARICEQVQSAQPARRVVLHVTEGAEVVEGDPLLLEQMLKILVCNASKYSPHATPIKIEARAGDGHLTIAVTDHGIGVPEDDLPRLFQPFFRSENTNSYAGNGLGLSLAKRIAELHGGTIDVESRQGSGSTFTVKLPASL